MLVAPWTWSTGRSKKLGHSLDLPFKKSEFVIFGGANVHIVLIENFVFKFFEHIIGHYAIELETGMAVLAAFEILESFRGEAFSDDDYGFVSRVFCNKRKFSFHFKTFK